MVWWTSLARHCVTWLSTGVHEMQSQLSEHECSEIRTPNGMMRFLAPKFPRMSDEFRWNSAFHAIPFHLSLIHPSHADCTCLIHVHDSLTYVTSSSQNSHPPDPRCTDDDRRPRSSVPLHWFFEISRSRRLNPLTNWSPLILNWWPTINIQFCKQSGLVLKSSYRNSKKLCP